MLPTWPRTLLLAALCATSHAAEPPAAPGRDDTAIVHTDLGALRGERRGEVIEYRGIPYAEPPVGNLRFRAPRPALPWQGVRDATHFGSACPQVHRFNLTDESLDEDCLTLNVSAPALAHPAGPAAPGTHGLPVIVWIHGGAFVGGSSNLYRLDRLAGEGGVVAVSMNYRLGVLGFMPHRAFDAADNGDYGLEDQREALRWIQRNIAAFGGDPGNVTVAGESAGAGSVCLHLANPDAVRGLFSKAVVLSGGCMQPMPRVADAADQTGARVAAAVGCGDPMTALDCLRQVPVRALLEAGDALGRTRILAFAPSIGTRTQPQQAADAMRAGEFLRVPVLAGAARDELRLYVAYAEQAGMHTTPANYASKLADHYGPFAPQVLKQYPLAPGASAPAQLGSILSDYTTEVGISNCLILETSATLSRHAPVYQFEFSDADARVLGVGITRDPDPGMPLGAVHSAMLNYFFPGMSNTAKIDAPALLPPSERLARSMVTALAAFARAGKPAMPGHAAWPRYAGGATTMRFEPGKTGLFDAVAAHRCKFWQSLYPHELDAL